jgi:hypothetical protein
MRAAASPDAAAAGCDRKPTAAVPISGAAAVSLSASRISVTNQSGKTGRERTMNSGQLRVVSKKRTIAVRRGIKNG